jgi:dephospho-CoA kinase
MLKIGLTGGIGCGKSAASRYLQELGAYVFDADKEAKKILDENETVQSELIAEFGTDILNAEGKIDRKKLARVAFQDEDHQMRLNAIIHPYVFEEIDRQYNDLAKTGRYPVFVVDGALIYESGLDQHLDYTVVVTATLRHRMERAMQRGTLNRDEILKRMELQWSEESKVGLADFVVHNNGTEEELKTQIKEIFDNFI